MVWNYPCCRSCKGCHADHWYCILSHYWKEGHLQSWPNSLQHLTYTRAVRQTKSFWRSWCPAKCCDDKSQISSPKWHRFPGTPSVVESHSYGLECHRCQAEVKCSHACASMNCCTWKHTCLEIECVVYSSQIERFDDTHTIKIASLHDTHTMKLTNIVALKFQFTRNWHLFRGTAFWICTWSRMINMIVLVKDTIY